MAYSMARKSEDRKRKRCESSPSTEETSAMPSAKRHATLHRKAERLEELHARVCIVCYNPNGGNFSLWPKEPAKAREIITEFRERKKTRSSSGGRKKEVRISDLLGSNLKKKRNGKKKGFDEKENLKLGKIIEALKTNIQTLEENIINSSFEGRKTKTIQPYVYGEESTAELLEPKSSNFNNGGPTLPISGGNFYDDNIEFRYGFDTNGICGNANLEPGYNNGDFGLVKPENFGGVDTYNYNSAPLGSYSSASSSCWVDMLQGRYTSMISPLDEAVLWPPLPLQSQMINDHNNYTNMPTLF
ncbi:PREDICTED: L484_025031 [Prunus dulcis]|uniref:PREDICTED: L484_025031 n=1 Tax=Prunus dulcis TaxID=3755 RepID=A0A5E4EE70_PRUDU|nr:uncharacterized protein LOC117638671 [Prunus dulcis]VVA13995.1 PREDICTED: L484_025031 [Prunus dulcis]